MANLNPEKVVKLEVEGKEYSLYFGMRAMRGFEVETGLPIQKVFAPDSEVGLQQIAMLVKHGLSQVHPAITMEEVDTIFDALGFDVVSTAAATALMFAFPQLQGNGRAPLVKTEAGEAH